MLPDTDHCPRGAPGERLHQLFEQRCDALAAEGLLQHLAVDSSAECLSYAQLDARANQLARYLREAGTRAGDVVGLLFDKSAWSYAAMLAVGKLHAVYLPLDPGFPADRINFIAQDAGMRRMLTLSTHRNLAEAAGQPVMCLDEAAPAIAAHAAHRLSAEEAGVPAGERCYIIYTSGSTGRPKGVPIDHPAIVNFVRVAAQTYGYQRSDRVYQGLTLAFDFAVEEIWVPLTVGATLLPSQSGGSLLGADLSDFLIQQQATALCCVPTLLATLEDELPLLRLMIVSGEACPRDLVTRWHQPGRSFLNAYGPTEATVTATLGRPTPGEPVTIGRPLPTYAIAILPPDETRALPFGEEGEIAIAGIGIAEGYLNRDDQTRKAFVKDTLGVPHNTSGRLYRTGDLGRINERGEVEYLGRIDTQIKIRGYRIEVAEIESLLLQRPEIAQAVVNPWTAGSGVVELVAYTTQHDGTAPVPAEELAAHLLQHLPPFMVPRFYEPLQRMPMLASDKADRKALPSPTRPRVAGIAQQGPVVPAANPLEERLAQSLGRLLQLPQVSVEAHVIDELGANSLLLARWGAALRGEPGCSGVSMRLIYRHPRIRALAQALTEAAASSASQATSQSSTSAQAVRLEPLQPHRASAWAYAGTGLAQLALMLCWLGLHASLIGKGIEWVSDAPGLLAAYARAVWWAAFYLGLMVAVTLAAKWLLIGRFKAGCIRAWSPAYLRFWVVKFLIRSNPLVLMAGTPLYSWYLRSLGARIHPTALFAVRKPPVATDLIEVGPGAVVDANAHIHGYHVESGWVRMGPVSVGAQAQVGANSLLDIHSSLGAGAMLAHASSLQPGQHVPASAGWHGSPAVPAGGSGPANRAIDDAALQTGQGVTALRRRTYTVLQLMAYLGLVLPLGPLLAFAATSAHGLKSGSMGRWVAKLGHADWLGLVALGYLLVMLVSLLVVTQLARRLAGWLRTKRTYTLYGVHHALLRGVQAWSNSRMFNAMFGDSSAIVHYLRAVGWRFPGLVQLGSNFGMAQQHDVPTLNTIGSGTMVSDGLTLLNADFGAHTFTLHEQALGKNSYLGNMIFMPPGHRVGDNCLLGTKVMVPVDGPLRENIGLLGSPPMEIPRSVRRDTEEAPQRTSAELAQSLSAKNRANAGSMLGYLIGNGLPTILLAWVWAEWGGELSEHGALWHTGFLSLVMLTYLFWFVLLDGASRGWAPLKPLVCSIYDAPFWRHERHWKLGLAQDNPLMSMLDGTPMKALVWRLMGVRIGRCLLDDGAAMTEKTLVEIGDFATLGQNCTLQGHSLEEGLFKSGAIRIGHGCTVGEHAVVHYATQLDDGAMVLRDAFVMKGEHLREGEIWLGNPAERKQVT